VNVIDYIVNLIVIDYYFCN